MTCPTIWNNIFACTSKKFGCKRMLKWAVKENITSRPSFRPTVVNRGLKMFNSWKNATLCCQFCDPEEQGPPPSPAVTQKLRSWISKWTNGHMGSIRMWTRLLSHHSRSNVFHAFSYHTSGIGNSTFIMLQIVLQQKWMVNIIFPVLWS